MIANTEVALVHGTSIPPQGETMNFGLRTILLLVATVLFIISVFTDTNWPEFIALGLAAFAFAFVTDALGWADRTFGTSTARDDSP